MSARENGDSREHNLISFSEEESESSDSSGELFKPSRSVLKKVEKSLNRADNIVESTRYFLRSNKLAINKKNLSNVEMAKVSYMSIEQALKLIPIFDGENSDSNHAFINACEFAIANIDPALKDMFLKGITTRLVGKAYRAIRYKQVNSFQDLQTILNSLAEKKQTLAQLHSKLTMLRYANGETIQQYADRAEQLFYDILEASNITSGLSDTESITKITSLQILTAFTEGLPHDTKIIVKACRPKVLSEAVQIALEEEASRSAQREIYKNIKEHKSRYKSQSNSTSKSSVSGKPFGDCFLCGRSNHQARQCRASEADKARYKESRKIEQRNVRVIICSYCKKPNHKIEECRKRKYVNEKKEKEKQTQQSGNEQTTGPSGGNQNCHTRLARIMHFEAELNENHIPLNIHQCTHRTTRFLLDTGSDLNLIKLSQLKNEVLVDETQKYNLKGINEFIVCTIGLVQLDVEFDNEHIPVPFQVIHDNFPIPHAGIIGKPFLVNNGLIIDYNTSKIVKPKRESLKLAPRTETVVPITTGSAEGTTLLIHSQNTQDGVIRLGNVVNTVKQGKILAIAINVTENSVQFIPPTLEEVSFEKFIEASIKLNTVIQCEDNTRSRMSRIKEIVNTEHLNFEERDSLWRVCSEFMDIFHLEGDSFPTTNIIQHEIRLKADAVPVNVRPYRLPFAHRQEIARQAEQLEKDKIIQPSDSPWNAPLIVVPKKADTQGKPQYRVCVDFRRLNQLTVGDAFPIPRIDEILDQLGRSRYYTTLDLASGYHQVAIKPEDREKTGFSTDKGHYEFIKMPFGLCGAPSTFQRLMNQVLLGINGTKAFVYLDDIIIYATDLPEHEERLREVFSRLQKSNLQLQPSKCHFLRREVIYLGHLITDAGVRPDPSKVSCVQKHPVPKNITEIKQFLGLTGYYRRFIENYSHLAKPLTRLLKKDTPFEWTTECQAAFKNLIDKLITAPVLQYPDFERTFILTTDASQFAIGSVLSQGNPGSDHPIAYASRTLNKAEQSYSTTEKELLSIVWSIKNFRPYLLGRKFQIYTDHRPLTWLFNVKDPGSRLMRWKLKLAEYHYEVIFKPGIKNTNADALSRLGQVLLTQTVEENSQVGYHEYREQITSQTVINHKVKEEAGDLFDAPQEYSLAHCVSRDLKLSQGIALLFRRKFGNIEILRNQNPKMHDVLYVRQEDRYIIYLVTKAKYWQKPSLEDMYKTLKNLVQLCKTLKIDKLAIPHLGSGCDGLDWPEVKTMVKFLFYNVDIEVKIYSKSELTGEEKQQIITDHHTNPLGGHRGIEQTIKRIKIQFDWDNLTEDVKKFVSACQLCQINKGSNHNVKQPMIISTTATEPFEKLFIDIVGPLPRTSNGNAYILTMQDDLTKFSIATAMENHEANTVAYYFVTSLVCVHGIPKTLVSDQGTEFLSKVLKDTCKLLKIQKVNTSPYHPQANGALERSHRTLGDYLRNYVNKDQSNWDSYIPYAMFVFNSSEHRVTGKQPYQLLYGRKLVVPGTFTKPEEPRYNYDDYVHELKQRLQASHEIARERLIQQKHKTKKIYDKNENSIDINIGDKILLQNKARRGKLSSQWLGPFEVKDINANENITIQKGRKLAKVHKNLVKLFIE